MPKLFHRDMRFVWAMSGVHVASSLLVWTATGLFGGAVGNAAGNEMIGIAERLVLGYGYSSPYVPMDAAVPTTSIPPLYVWFVALVFDVLGIDSLEAHLALQMANLAFQVASLQILYRCVARLFCETTAKVFAFLFAISPHLIYLAVNIWESSLTLLLLSAAFYWALFEIDFERVRSFVVLGLLLGAIALSNPTWTLAYPFLVISVLSRQRPFSLGDFARNGSLTFVCFALVVGPWLYRNYSVTGELMYVRGMAGPILFWGNHKEAYGGHGQGMQDYFFLSNADETKIYAEMGERAYSNMMGERAVDSISGNPGRFFMITAARVGMWWTGDVDLLAWYRDNGRVQHFLFGLLLTVCGALTSILAFYGTWQLRGRFYELNLLWIYMYLLPIPYYFTTIGFRYHASIIAFVLIPVAYVLAKVVPRDPPPALMPRRGPAP